MPRKRTPKPLAPHHLLEELFVRQQTLIKQHSKDLINANRRPTKTSRTATKLKGKPPSHVLKVP